MLPFLKPKNSGVAGLIIKNRNPDKAEEKDQENQEDSKNHGQALIDAVHANDSEAVNKALEAAFKAFDKKPHEEGKHLEPHSYEASKQEE